MSEIGEIQTPDVADIEPVEDEDVFGSDSEEVVLKSPEDAITRKDIRELMNGWEDKSHKISEGVRVFEMSTHDVHTHMDVVMRESRARESAQVSANKQMKSIQEALTRFMEAYDPASNSRKHLRATLRAHDGIM